MSRTQPAPSSCSRGSWGPMQYSLQWHETPCQLAAAVRTNDLLGTGRVKSYDVAVNPSDQANFCKHCVVSTTGGVDMNRVAAVNPSDQASSCKDCLVSTTGGVNLNRVAAAFKKIFVPSALPGVNQEMRLRKEHSTTELLGSRKAKCMSRLCTESVRSG